MRFPYADRALQSLKSLLMPQEKILSSLISLLRYGQRGRGWGWKAVRSKTSKIGVQLYYEESCCQSIQTPWPWEFTVTGLTGSAVWSMDWPWSLSVAVKPDSWLWTWVAIAEAPQGPTVDKRRCNEAVTNTHISVNRCTPLLNSCVSWNKQPQIQVHWTSKNT